MLTPPSYIVPIVDSSSGSYKFVGTGFIIGKYLITAAHVATFHSGFCLSAIIGQDAIHLDFFNRKILITPTDNDCDSFDLAVFSVMSDDVDSPLTSADKEPVYDEENGVLMTSKHFQPLENGDCFYRECDCLVTRQSPSLNYCFEGFNIDRTIGGSSGSPLIKDNVVYGMLIQGRTYSEESIQAAIQAAAKAGLHFTQEEAHALNHNLIFLKASEIRKIVQKL